MLPDIFYSRRARDSFIQSLFSVAVVLLIVAMVLLTRQNVDDRGLLSAFKFLGETTGWDISAPVVPYSTRDTYWYALLVGLANTLVLGGIGLGLASVIGVIIGAARTSRNHVARLLGTIYVEIFRNVPEILQVFFWYQVMLELPTVRNAHQWGDVVFLSNRGLYVPWPNADVGMIYAAVIGLFLALLAAIWVTVSKHTREWENTRRRRAQLTCIGVGVVVALVALWLGHTPQTPLISTTTMQGLRVDGGLRISPALIAMVITLATFGGAYIGEIVRGGFIAVRKGQFEAAFTLGLNAPQTFFKISLPLAFRAMLPALTNRYVWLMKATTLGVAVGFSDFFMTVTIAIDKVGHTIALITILMLGFLAINLTITVLMNKLNQSIQLRGNWGNN